MADQGDGGAPAGSASSPAQPAPAGEQDLPAHAPPSPAAGHGGMTHPGRAAVNHPGGPGVGDPSEAWPTGRLLSAAARRVERAWDAYLALWSLSHASLPVLALLVGGELSQREIAAHLGVTEQSMSRMVAGLERSGYVQRSRRPPPAHGADHRGRPARPA